MRYQKYILPVFFLVILSFFIVYPICTVIIKSFDYQGEIGIGHYVRLFTHPYFINLIFGSIGLAAGSAITSTGLGLILSVSAFRLKLFGSRLFSISAVLPMILPGFVTTLSYIFLFGRNGLITYQWLNLNWDIYSWKSVLILQTLGFSTTTFFLISAVLVNINHDAENAARNLGANDWQTFLTITLPLIKPGIYAAFSLSFFKSLADFGTPFIIGGRFNTLATMAYSKLIGTYDTGLASALSVVLLLISAVAFGFYSRSIRFGKIIHFSISAKNDIPPLKLPLPIRIFFGIVCWLFSLIMIFLLLAILAAAFTDNLGAGFQFTFKHFDTIFQQGANSIRNTILFATLTSIFTTVLGCILAYISLRISFRGKRLIDFLATIPFAIPGTFFGIGYALAYNQEPILLAGTWSIVIICTVFRELPLSLRSNHSLLTQLDQEIEYASENLGAGKIYTFLRIVIPMIRPALLVSMIYAFITTVKTLGAIIFIINPRNKVLSVDVFEATVRGDVGNASAFSLILILISLIGVALMIFVNHKFNRFKSKSNNTKQLIFQG